MADTSSSSELPAANMETLLSGIASAKPNTAFRGSPFHDEYAPKGDYAQSGNSGDTAGSDATV